MAEFEFQITRRIELIKTITVKAKDEDAAQAKADAMLEKMEAEITITAPDDWEAGDYEIEAELL